MAWTFIGVAATGSATGTPLTLTEPAGSRDGDLLIACIASRTTSTTSITNTGWTLVAEQKTNNILTDTTAIASGAMLAQVRNGTPDLTFTLPAAGTSIAFGRIVAYRGELQTTPSPIAGALDASTAVTTATNTLSVSVAGLTTTQADDLIVAMTAGGQEAAWSVFDAATDPSVASGATNTSTAPTAGTWIERADSSTTTGADTSLAIFDAIKASAGATGNLTATASLGAGHVVIAGAFKIAVATADAWDQSDKTLSVTLTNSDKTATRNSTGSGSAYVRSSTKRANGTAGKYYAEFLANELTSGLRVGISNATADFLVANAFYATEGGIVQVDGVSSAANLGAAADGDIFGVAWDAGAERVWFRRNGGLWNNDASADPATNTNGLDVSAHASVDHALWARLDVVDISVTIRTEAAEFTYTGPSGFTSWMGEALSSTVNYTDTITPSALPIDGQTITPVYVGSVAYTDTITASAVPIGGQTVTPIYTANYTDTITASAVPIDGQTVTPIYTARYTDTLTAGTVPIGGQTVVPVYTANYADTLTAGALPISGSTIVPIYSAGGINYSDTITSSVLPIGGSTIAPTYTANYADTIAASSLPVGGQAITPVYTANYADTLVASALPVGGATFADVFARGDTIAPSSVPVGGATVADLYNRTDTLTAGTLPITGATVTPFYTANYTDTLTAGVLAISGQAITPLFSAGGINYSDVIAVSSLPVEGQTITAVYSANYSDTVAAAAVPITGLTLADVLARGDILVPSGIPIGGQTITPVFSAGAPTGKTWVKVDGVWEETTTYVKVGGVWTHPIASFVKDGGVWKAIQ